MPQKKKNKPINFKPSDKTLLNLKILRFYNVGKTTTSILESAISQAANSVVKKTNPVLLEKTDFEPVENTSTSFNFIDEYHL